MRKLWLLGIALCVSILALSCDDDGTGSSSSSGANGSETSNIDGGEISNIDGGETRTDAEQDVGADGPWICLLPNEQYNTETGERRVCGFMKCWPGIGCPKYRCDSDEDCIEDTSVVGWEGGVPVICDQNFDCEMDPNEWEEWPDSGSRP